MSKDPVSSASSLATTAEETPREFNVDELEVNILLIAKSQSSVQSAAQFLSRRDWPTKIATDLSKAIQIIAKEKPDLILISINHPSPKIMKLPNIIAAGFNATCVLFSEVPDAKSASLIQAAKLQHKISGGASGPNLYRGIRKILNQLYNPVAAAADEKSESDGKDQKDRPQVIEGDSYEVSTSYQPKSDSEYTAIEGSKKSASGRRKLRDLDTQHMNSGPSMYMDKGEAKKQGLSAAELLKMFQANDDSNGLEFNAQNYQALEEINAIEEATSSKNSDVLQAAASKSKRFFDLWSRKSSHLDGAHSPKPNKKLKVQLEAVAEQFHQAERTSTATEEKPKLQFGLETRESIKEVLLHTFNENAEVFLDGPVNSLAVVLLKSKVHRGFLVIGLSEPMPSNELSDGFKENLNKYFASKNADAEVELGFAMNIEQIMLEDWINIEANYSLQLTHEEHKVEAGVFDYENDPSNLAIVDEKEMVSIDLSMIDPDHDLPFKAYLHLKKNGKYYKYVNRGRRMQGKQKEKLEAQNIELKIAKADLPQLKIYCLSLEIKKRIKSLNLSQAKTG